MPSAAARPECARRTCVSQCRQSKSYDHSLQVVTTDSRPAVIAEASPATLPLRQVRGKSAHFAGDLAHWVLDSDPAARRAFEIYIAQQLNEERAKKKRSEKSEEKKKA
mgnify:CR=1 FL=1